MSRILSHQSASSSGRVQAGQWRRRAQVQKRTAARSAADLDAPIGGTYPESDALVRPFPPGARREGDDDPSGARGEGQPSAREAALLDAVAACTDVHEILAIVDKSGTEMSPFCADTLARALEVALDATQPQKRQALLATPALVPVAELLAATVPDMNSVGLLHVLSLVSSVWPYPPLHKVAETAALALVPAHAPLDTVVPPEVSTFRAPNTAQLLLFAAHLSAAHAAAVAAGGAPGTHNPYAAVVDAAAAHFAAAAGKTNEGDTVHACRILAASVKASKRPWRHVPKGSAKRVVQSLVDCVQRNLPSMHAGSAPSLCHPTTPNRFAHCFALLHTGAPC